jgi:hypothetical protein
MQTFLTSKLFPRGFFYLATWFQSLIPLSSSLFHVIVVSYHMVSVSCHVVLAYYDVVIVSNNVVVVSCHVVL